MVVGRIFPKITGFYLGGSPSAAEIVYSDKVRRVHIRLGGQEEQITAGPEGVIYITKGYPSALQIKWALKFQKKKFLPYFKFFEAASLAYPEVSSRLTKQDSEFVHHSALEGRYSVRYRIVRSSRRKNTQIAYEGGLLVVRCPTKLTDFEVELELQKSAAKIIQFLEKMRRGAPTVEKEPTSAEAANSIRLADGAEVQIIWQPGKRKSISISMPNSEQLLVKYPTNSSREKVMGWVLSQQAWIQKKRQKSLGKEDTNRAFFEKLFSEHEIVLLDVKRKVRVSSVRKESGVFDDEVVLWIKDANISREQFLEVLVKTIKKWALTALQEEFELKLAQMGPFRYPYRKFFLTSAKTRWGSCSSRGHVRIHWNTVFVTKSERDYLYTHEAAHLTEMNHSPRFWQLVEVHCPGYKRARTILHSRTLGFL